MAIKHYDKLINPDDELIKPTKVGVLEEKIIDPNKLNPFKPDVEASKLNVEGVVVKVLDGANPDIPGLRFMNDGYKSQRLAESKKFVDFFSKLELNDSENRLSIIFDLLDDEAILLLADYPELIYNIISSGAYFYYNTNLLIKFFNSLNIEIFRKFAEQVDPKNNDMLELINNSIESPEGFNKYLNSSLRFCVLLYGKKPDEVVYNKRDRTEEGFPDTGSLGDEEETHS